MSVSSNIGRSCQHCVKFLDSIEKFDDSVNHYLGVHGYRILHVGQETIFDAEGKPWQTTVAVLGL